MIDWLFSSIWGWIGVAGLVVIAAGVVAWFIPQARIAMAAIAGAAIAAASLYTKGQRDAREAERKRREAAIAKAQEEYAKIEARGDTPDDVEKRLDRGTF